MQSYPHLKHIHPSAMVVLLLLFVMSILLPYSDASPSTRALISAVAMARGASMRYAPLFHAMVQCNDLCVQLAPFAIPMNNLADDQLASVSSAIYQQASTSSVFSNAQKEGTKQQDVFDKMSRKGEKQQIVFAKTSEKGPKQQDVFDKMSGKGAKQQIVFATEPNKMSTERSFTSRVDATLEGVFWPNAPTPPPFPATCDALQDMSALLVSDQIVVDELHVHIDFLESSTFQSVMALAHVKAFLMSLERVVQLWMSALATLNNETLAPHLPFLRQLHQLKEDVQRRQKVVEQFEIDQEELITAMKAVNQVRAKKAADAAGRAQEAANEEIYRLLRKNERANE